MRVDARLRSLESRMDRNTDATCAECGSMLRGPHKGQPPPGQHVEFKVIVRREGNDGPREGNDEPRREHCPACGAQVLFVVKIPSARSPATIQEAP